MMGLTTVVITIAMMTPMRANTDDREDDICWDEMMGMIGMIAIQTTKTTDVSQCTLHL